MQAESDWLVTISRPEDALGLPTFVAPETDFSMLPLLPNSRPTTFVPQWPRYTVAVAYTFSQQITLAVVPRLVALLVRTVGATLQYEDRFDPESKEPIRGDLVPGPTVYAFWHRTLLVCAHRFRNKGIAILISRSFDGELIARTVELLGFHAVRGSSSRGGVAGLRGMVEAYEAGHRCAITVDGPRGPAMVAQSGATQLAQLVHAPWIGTYYALPDRAWALKSWDRFLIPKPFARVTFTWPAPILTEGHTAAQLQESVQAALDFAVALAGSETDAGR